MSSFGPVAPYYDELMRPVPYRMWVGYLQLLQATIGVRPRTLLDVCCGTGVMAELLTKEGFEVEGFDLSPQMIRVARRRAKDASLPIRYHVADASEVDLGSRFDGAFSFFDSLNYITELDRFGMAIQRVARHLEPGGSFIFDLNTAYAFEQGMFDQIEMAKRRPLRYKWVSRYEPESRQITVDMDFWRGEKHFKEVHRQRAHSDEEVRAALEAAGFGSIRVFDSYTLDPPRERSDRVHYAAVLGG